MYIYIYIYMDIVAVCCSEVQGGAVCYSVLQCVSASNQGLFLSRYASSSKG